MTTYSYIIGGFPYSKYITIPNKKDYIILGDYVGSISLVYVPTTNATASTVSLVGYGISQVNVTASTVSLVGYGISQVNATASTASLIGYGISQVNIFANVYSFSNTCVGSALSQVKATTDVSISENLFQIIPSTTNATASTVSLTCSSTLTYSHIIGGWPYSQYVTFPTAKDYIIPGNYVEGIVFPHEALITQVNVSISSISLDTIYSANISIVPISAYAVASTTNTVSTISANIYIFSNYASSFLVMEDGINGFELEDDSGIIALENSNTTTVTTTSVGSVIAEFGGNVVLFQTNSYTSASDLFTNIQILVPSTNSTISTTSLVGLGISQAKASVSTKSFIPEVNVDLIGIATATTKNNSLLPNVQVNAVSVSSIAGFGLGTWKYFNNFFCYECRGFHHWCNCKSKYKCFKNQYHDFGFFDLWIRYISS